MNILDIDVFGWKQGPMSFFGVGILIRFGIDYSIGVRKYTDQKFSPDSRV